MSIAASSVSSVSGDVTPAHLSRRAVLTGTVAVGGAIALAPLVPQVPPAIAAVITDPRLAQSRLFLAGIGTAARPMEVGIDAVRTWQQCRSLLARGARVAGLTTWMDSLILHGCAREDGFACVHRGEHEQRDGGVTHMLGDAELLGALLRASGGWPRVLGARLALGEVSRMSGISPSGAASGAGMGHIRMVSWLLAPR